MFEIAYSQLSFAASVVFAIPFDLRSLDRLIEGLLATQHEFGPIGAEATELLGGPTLDEATRREVQLRRFRTQAKRAVRETTYYRRLFEQGLDPTRLSYEHQRLPSPPKIPCAAILTPLFAGARPVFRTTTIGTTGWPTSICPPRRCRPTSPDCHRVADPLIIGPQISSRSTPARAPLQHLLAGARAWLALVCPDGLVGQT
jgi:hypothetical protein